MIGVDVALRGGVGDDKDSIGRGAGVSGEPIVNHRPVTLANNVGAGEDSVGARATHALGPESVGEFSLMAEGGDTVVEITHRSAVHIHPNPAPINMRPDALLRAI